MPRAIPDSDDDEDELAPEFEYDGGKPRLLPAPEQVEGAINTLDGSNDKSTGSTEQLRRQLQSAERGLLSNSAPLRMEAPTFSSSPTKQALKRRHTAVFRASVESASSPGNRFKRTKTYEKHRTHLDEEEDVEHNAEDRVAPVTSQSAIFTEHSQTNSPAGLPTGSLEADFFNHEPTVMFRDSGTTVADTSSERQRLIEQALNNRHDHQVLTVDDIQEDDPRSSSILFPSTSGQTNSARSTRKTGNVGNGLECDEDTPKNNATTNGSSAQTDNETHEHVRNPQPSPAVEILRQERETSAASSGTPATTQKLKKSRKQKDESADDADSRLKSDDRPVGLPAEQYNPRPSRRRATQAVYEEVDFSVRPEKAAKAKRTRTTQTAADLIGNEANQSLSFHKDSPSLPASKPTTANNGTHDNLQTYAGLDKPAADESEIPSASKQDANSTPSQNIHSVSGTAEQRTDDKIFVKPAKPSPKTKPASKAKRSHTTIYEDHVEFTGSQRSPNLSQQQAKRKSALQDVTNEASFGPQKKKRDMVLDDDDEDELPQDIEEVEKEESPPKKRRRGRPSKQATKAKPKSAETVLEDSDEELVDQSETEEAPKKRGRGRPAKTVAPSKSIDPSHNDETSITQRVDEDSCPSKLPTKEMSQQEEAGTAKADPGKTTSSASRIPTPSPEKSDGAKAPTPQKAPKASPTTHSPIKKSSKYRVGLSKRSRIPPLLRTMNQPKR